MIGTPRSTDPFGLTYSPRQIRFWTMHWTYLVGLVYDPAANRDRAEWLRREWDLLQNEHGALVCLCEKIDAHPPLAVGLGRSSSRGSGLRGFGAIKLDLEAAANNLPIHWAATRDIYVLQERPQVWNYWFALWRDRPQDRRPQDREPEPNGSSILVIDRMAEFLGWRKEHDVHG